MNIRSIVFGGTAMAIAVILALVIGVLPASAALSVTVTSQNMRYVEGFFTKHWVIEGQVQNQGNEASGPITVEGVLTDESGTIVARSTAEPAPNVLQPGQSGTFSIPFALQLSEHFKDYRVSVLSQGTPRNDNNISILNNKLNEVVDFCLGSLPNGTSTCDNELSPAVSKVCAEENAKQFIDACNNEKVVQYYKTRNISAP